MNNPFFLVGLGELGGTDYFLHQMEKRIFYFNSSMAGPDSHCFRYFDAIDLAFCRKLDTKMSLKMYICFT